MSTQELVSCPPTWVCCRVMARPDTRQKRRACGELRELAAETAVECPAGTRSELKRAQFEALVQAVTQQELTPEQRVRLHELTELYFQSEAGVMLSTEIRMSSCSLAVQRLPSLYIMLYIYILYICFLHGQSVALLVGASGCPSIATQSFCAVGCACPIAARGKACSRTPTFSPQGICCVVHLQCAKFDGR